MWALLFVVGACELRHFFKIVPLLDTDWAGVEPGASRPGGGVGRATLRREPQIRGRLMPGSHTCCALALQETTASIRSRWTRPSAACRS